MTTRTHFVTASRRLAWASLGLLLVFLGCQDATSPQPMRSTGAIHANGGSWLYTGSHVLIEGSSAPALGSYQASLTAYVGKTSGVVVNYQPTGTQSAGDPYLYFMVPRDGLISAPDGTLLQHGDSLTISLSLTSDSLAVTFQPSGLVFNPLSPPVLVMCYEHANLDLDHDGVVDSTDYALLQTVGIWYEPAKGPPVKLPSKNYSANDCVSSPITHFSGYAVSW